MNIYFQLLEMCKNERILISEFEKGISLLTLFDLFDVF